jgi:hypothetical protein
MLFQTLPIDQLKLTEVITELDRLSARRLDTVADCYAKLRWDIVQLWHLESRRNFRPIIE